MAGDRRTLGEHLRRIAHSLQGEAELIGRNWQFGDTARDMRSEAEMLRLCADRADLMERQIETLNQRIEAATTPKS